MHVVLLGITRPVLTSEHVMAFVYYGKCYTECYKSKAVWILRLKVSQDILEIAYPVHGDLNSKI